MRVGVDVGGTNTDAVLMDGEQVVDSFKAPTTADIGGGIVNAIRTVLAQSNVIAEHVESVMIGTTQFTNAFVEGRRLVEVGIIRAALPATLSVKPLLDFPERLANAVGDHAYLVPGGYEFDGREISPLGEKEVSEGPHGISNVRALARSLFPAFSLRLIPTWKNAWRKSCETKFRMWS